MTTDSTIQKKAPLTYTTRSFNRIRGKQLHFEGTSLPELMPTDQRENSSYV